MSRITLDLYEQAQSLQRKGMTFTEIAEIIGVSRPIVVNALYYDMVNKIVGETKTEKTNEL